MKEFLQVDWKEKELDADNVTQNEGNFKISDGRTPRTKGLVSLRVCSSPAVGDRLQYPDRCDKILLTGTYVPEKTDEKHDDDLLRNPDWPHRYRRIWLDFDRSRSLRIRRVQSHRVGWEV